jgi:hypothetical protein
MQKLREKPPKGGFFCIESRKFRDLAGLFRKIAPDCGDSCQIPQ